jgi:hypothetical protein
MLRSQSARRHTKRIARNQKRAAEYARLLESDEVGAGRCVADGAAEILGICDLMTTQPDRNTAFLVSVDVLQREEQRSERKGGEAQAQWCVGLQNKTRHDWGT